MDRLLYNSTLGASNIERALSVRAHNLANVATTGFRADYAQAQAFWAEGDGHPVRAYGLTQIPGVDFRQGTLMQTGRELDVAVKGEGFLAVQTESGGEAYTRAGDLQVDELGRLLDREGQQVLGDTGPIALPPFDRVYIGSDGGISVQPEGQSPETLVQVGRLKLVNPDTADLSKDGAGRIVRSDGGIEAPDAAVEVVAEFLESSNVSAVSELTEILSLARQFEVEVRMMRTAQENDEAASSLLRLG
ncbi:MAG: flagellar basal-body rod protein FlgF [Pseudomonadales bacterium]|nr:flagellar basal-body rod protein FlgF [Pseudomonadales bacterium]